jgi:LmbE family N-acetylglucosaminyl deacetylase
MPAPSVSAQTRLLVVAPHPDDETLGCGLLIQQVLAAGGAVRVLLLTDGDNNPWPQRYRERRARIDTTARRRWGARRRDEAARAIARLGLPIEALETTGWPDMGLTAKLCDDAPGATSTLRTILRAFGPNLVCCPDLSDRHPDHGAAHVLCRLALAGLEPEPILLAYHVHGQADTSASPMLIDAPAEQWQRKLQALAEHKTQMMLSRGRLRRLALSPERYIRANGLGGSGYLPWRPPVMLRPWLRLLVATPDGVKDLRWKDAPIVSDTGGCRLQVPGRGPAFAKLHLDWPSLWIFDHWGWHAL